MMHRIVCLAVALLVTSTAGMAQQSSDGTLGGLLRSYLAMQTQNCPRAAADLAASKAKGDVGAIVAQGQLYQTLCVCHPARTRALLESLPASRLNQPAVGDNDFNSVAVPGIQRPCIAEQLHGMFGGKTCAGFKSTDIKPGTPEAAFCGCMKDELDGWSDDDLASLPGDLGPFSAAVKSAKRNAGRQPLPPPLVDRYVSSLNRCGGGQEFVF